MALDEPPRMVMMGGPERSADATTWGVPKILSEASSDCADRRATIASMLTPSSPTASPTATLRDALGAFLRLAAIEDLLPPDRLEQSMREMEVELLGLAAEAQKAEVRRVPLAAAMRDFENYPGIAKLHAMVENIVTLELPRELEVWALRLASAPPPPALEAMLRALVRAARRDPAPLHRNLARLLLVEGLCMQLVLRLRCHPEETFGVGMDEEDACAIAEAEVNHWLIAPEEEEREDFRPLHVMAVAAIEEFSNRAELLALALRGVGRELRAALDQRARWEAVLASVDARNAILVRNEFAPEFGAQRLTLDMLKERHQAAFGDVTRNALDQRLRDMRRRLAKAGPAILRRKRVALIDLVKEDFQRNVLTTEGAK